jgi:hypothetical protein
LDTLREKLPAFLANFLPQLVLSRQTLIVKRNAIGQQENIILYVNILYILRFSRELHKENVQDFCIVILFSKLFIFKQKFLIILMLASPCTIKQFVQLFINALIV